jgi:uncharacterized protein YegP (UPF0339 family)
MPEGPAWYIYEDTRSEWRWSLAAANNKTVADSGEGYGSRPACVQAIARLDGYLRDPRLHVHNETPPSYQ